MSEGISGLLLAMGSLKQPQSSEKEAGGGGGAAAEEPLSPDDLAPSLRRRSSRTAVKQNCEFSITSVKSPRSGWVRDGGRGAMAVHAARGARDLSQPGHREAIRRLDGAGIAHASL